MSRSAALLDLATRLALFVLAAVATLSIPGALVAIPGDVARILARLEERSAPPVEPQRAERRVEEQGDSANEMPVMATYGHSPLAFADRGIDHGTSADKGPGSGPGRRMGRSDTVPPPARGA